MTPCEARSTRKQNCIRFLDRVAIDMPVIDLSSLAAEERAARVAQLIREDAGVPFDLVNGPLCRAVLIRLQHDHHALVFTTHHLVCDGWSTNILLDELSRLYAARLRRSCACDLPEPMHFSRYALSQAEWVTSPERRSRRSLVGRAVCRLRSLRSSCRPTAPAAL